MRNVYYLSTIRMIILCLGWFAFGYLMGVTKLWHKR